MTNSKIKLLLISPQYDDKSVPPFGVAYLAGFLRGQSTVDLTVINSDEYSIKQIEKMVREEDYDVFATGGLITCLEFCQRVFRISEAAKPDAKRIVGGPLTVLDNDLLFQYLPVDIAVLGEGEETLSEVLEVLRQDGNISTVSGIIYREKDNLIRVTEPRHSINLEKRELEPDWSFVDMERYINCPSQGFQYNRKELSRPYRYGFIMSGRGCPFRCNFCGSPLGKFRRRTEENIIKEMKLWRDKYHVDHIKFINETLFMRPADIQTLCQRMVDEHIDLRWSCSLRVDLINRESLEIMRKAGCDYIIYGVESGSDRVLKRMNKRTTVEQNRIAIRLTREAGIYPDVAIMFGYIDETLEDMKMTVDFMLEGNDLPESLAVTTAMPGTELYKEFISGKLIVYELEYIKNMCSELSKGSIYGCRKPLLNATKIPDSIYWSSILSEKRRLNSEHFIKNRAIVSSSEYHKGDICLTISCPHCGFSFQTDMRSEPLIIEKQFCRQCLRYIWIDSYMMPELKEHFEQVGKFLQNIQKESKSLVLYIPGSNVHALKLFEVDPWNLIWSNITAIITDDVDGFFDFRTIRETDAHKIAPAHVLIMDMDQVKIRKRLVCLGFSANEIMSILPIIPMRNVYQFKNRLITKYGYYCPDTLKPAAKKMLSKLRGLLN